MNAKMIDLEVDYIDSRSITKKELSEISAYIQSRRFNTAKPAYGAKHVPLQHRRGDKKTITAI